MSSYRLSVRAAGRAEMLIYGDIGSGWVEDGVTASRVAADLKAVGKVSTLDVRINSYGGDVFEGLAIYRQIVNFDASVNVFVDGVAASAASIIAVAGNKIEIAQAGFLMIHDAWTFAAGNADELRATAERLDATSEAMASIYSARTKKSSTQCRDLMRVETWMTAQEAVDNGFADSIAPNMAIAAKADPKRFAFRNLPTVLGPRRQAAVSVVTQMRAHLLTKRPAARSA